MKKITSIKDFDLTTELGEFLFKKFENIINKYNLDDISEYFSVVILEENEGNYFDDKLTEFCEEVTFDGIKYIHTVLVSESYSEDIYIPYSIENMAAVGKGF